MNGMTSQEIVELSLQHTLFSWSATGSVSPIPAARAQGIYFWDRDGKRYIDFNSQLMSVNIGHSHPKVVARMKELCDELLFIHPGATCEVRARLGQYLAQLVPGDINTFFFALGGAEANENAIKAARLYTGKHKILTKYRSYHGATHAAMMMTGDPRRVPNEPGAPGFIHFMDPWPYTFEWGQTEEEITARHLTYLEEVIQYEGPQSIAAIFLETVTGTNGILIPPKGWIAGVRALTEKYNILMACDEVMCGFGRTGKLFGFEHYGIVPDIITMAKGITSSYVPLGAMGVRDKIADHFRKNVFYGGLTYNAHAFTLGVALANLEVLIGEGMVENAARLGPVMTAHLERLQARHPSVRTHRNIGLFGIFELQKNRRGERICGFNQASPVMNKVNRFLLDNGLFTFIRWDGIMCNPPLCITDAELQESFDILDRALEITDAALED